MNIQQENQIKQYFKVRPEVAAVYLFGSHAKGNSSKGSDIDLGILLKHEFASNEREFHKRFLSGLKES